MTALTPLPPSALKGLELHPASAVDLRRDLYLFVDFVRREGLKRAHRSNGIPKGPALKLAKLLSWAGEPGAIERDGEGDWSNYISDVARELGLVSFDVEGSYAGYSSNEPSFPDNHVTVNDNHFDTWLSSSPLKKERAILDKLVETAPSEFFNEPQLFHWEPRFDSWGSETGPHSRMTFPPVRKRLLELLAALPTGEWLPMEALIQHVKTTARAAILSPDLKRRPTGEKSAWNPRLGKTVRAERDDLYQNFQEISNMNSRSEVLTEATADVYERVEGRYLQYFLQGIPYQCGFVDLALVKLGTRSHSDTLPLERVRAFRLAPKLAQVLRGDPSLDRVSVTVLADFNVIVEAPSWPDRELDQLNRYCLPVKEEWPTHALRIDRKRVLTWVAAHPEAPPIAPALQALTARALPGNVAAELDAWSGHAEKLTVLKDVTLVELLGPDADAVRAELGKLVLAESPTGFAVTRDAERTVAVLEQRQRAPRVVAHKPTSFAPGEGRLCTPARAPRAPAAPKRRRATFAIDDLVGCRSDDPKLLRALFDALDAAGHGPRLIAAEGLLLVRATDLPRVRAALRTLADRFDVEETR